MMLVSCVGIEEQNMFACLGLGQVNLMGFNMFDEIWNADLIPTVGLI